MTSSPGNLQDIDPKFWLPFVFRGNQLPWKFWSKLETMNTDNFSVGMESPACIKSVFSTTLGPKDLRFAPIKMSAYEKARSLEVPVNGIHKYFLANSATYGRLLQLFFQRVSKSNSFMSSLAIVVRKYLCNSSSKESLDSVDACLWTWFDRTEGYFFVIIFGDWGTTFTFFAINPLETANMRLQLDDAREWFLYRKVPPLFHSRS